MLELKNFSGGYGQSNVLSQINLSFHYGSIYTIVGKNGCGKSTLLKSCAGFLKPDAGTILFCGKELKQYTSTERACMFSYLSQCRNTPGITAERLVMHGRYPHLSYPKKLRSRDKDMIDKVMRLMKVDHLRQKSLRELSGGERQRVYLAMQLAQDTPIMFLDEPTTYMDIEYQLLFLEILVHLKKEGKLIVMVLHDLEQALRYSDEIIAMDNGTVIQTGTPDEILSHDTLTKIFHINVECMNSENKSRSYLFSL